MRNYEFFWQFEFLTSLKINIFQLGIIRYQNPGIPIPLRYRIPPSLVMTIHRKSFPCILPPIEPADWSQTSYAAWCSPTISTNQPCVPFGHVGYSLPISGVTWRIQGETRPWLSETNLRGPTVLEVDESISQMWSLGNILISRGF